MARHWLTIKGILLPEPKYTFLGIGYRTETDREGEHYLQWSLPHWLFVIPAGLIAYVAKPKPLFRFSLRELFVLLTIMAITVGTLAAVLRIVIS